MKKIILIAALAAFGLAACGGGGGGVAGTVALGGVAAKGPIAGGVVTVTDSSNPAIVTTGVTDASGKYNVTLPTTSVAPFTLTITGGIDTITGNKPDFPLSVLVTDTPVAGVLTQINANANVFSTVIAAATKAKAASITKASGVAPTATELKAILVAQESNIVQSLNLGLPAGSKPATGALNKSNTSAILKANEALAEVIRRTAVDSAKVNSVATSTSSTGVSATAIDFANTIAMMAADASDGALDGTTTQTALAAAGATASVTPATAQALVQIAAVNTAVVIGEVVSNTLKVTNASGNVVKDSYSVAAALDIYGAAAVVNTAGTFVKTDAVSAAGNTALTAQITAVVAAAKLAVVVDAYSATKNIAVKTQKDTALNALLASVTAITNATAGSNVTTVQIALAATVQNDSYAFAAVKADAAVAATVAEVQKANPTQTQAQVAVTVTAQATSLVQDIYAQAQASAAVQAATTAANGAVVDIYVATTAAPVKTVATVTVDIYAVSAADTAAKAVADAAALAAATGVVIRGNTISIGGQAVTLTAAGVASLTAGVTATAVPLMMNIPLVDYYSSLATAVTTTLGFSITQPSTSRQISGTLAGVGVSSTTAGAVAVAIPTTGFNYTGKTVAGTAVSNNVGTPLNVSNEITSANSSLSINLSALAMKVGVVLRPGTYNFTLGLGSVNLGFDNVNSTGLNGLLPSNVYGKGITGTFTVQ